MSWREIAVILISFLLSLQLFRIPSFPGFSYGNITKVLTLIICTELLMKRKILISQYGILWLVLFFIGFSFAQVYGSSSNAVFQSLASLKFFVWYFLIIYLFRTEKDIYRILAWYFVISLITVVIVRMGFSNSLLNWLFAQGAVREIKHFSGFVSETSQLKRQTFLNLDPNVYGDLLVLGLLSLFYLWHNVKSKIKRRVFLIPCSAVGFMGLLVTGSRGAYMQLLFGSIAMYLAYGWVTIKKLTNVIIFIAVSVFLLFALSPFNPAFKIVTERLSQLTDPVVSLITGRTGIIEAMYLAERGETLTARLGVALITLRNYFIGDPIRLLFGYFGHMHLISPPPGNHVGFVQWLVEFGLITFLPIVGWHIYLMRKLLILRKKYLYYKINSSKFTLLVLCIGFLVSFIIKQLYAPAGFNLLIYFGLITVSIKLCSQELRVYQIQEFSTNSQ